MTNIGRYLKGTPPISKALKVVECYVIIRIGFEIRVDEVAMNSAPRKLIKRQPPKFLDQI